MDLLVKALQEHKTIIQRNKQKLDDFELRYNSLSSTFAHYIIDNNTNLQNNADWPMLEIGVNRNETQRWVVLEGGWLLVVVGCWLVIVS